MFFNLSAKKIESKKIDNSYICSLFLGILKENKNNFIDIKSSLPDVEDKDTEEIMNIAEKYAELLVYINTEKFNESIHKILSDYKKQKPYNYKHILLIDNIIHFWDVYYAIESKKQYKKYNQTQPLVRPAEVFSLKR